MQYEDLSNNYEAGLDRVLARLGVVTPSSEMPEATVLSQTTPHEQKAKPPTLKMRVLIAIAIGIVAYLLLRRVLPPAVFESLERRIPGIIEEILEHLRG